MKSLPKSRRFLVLIVQLFERNANSPKLEIQFEFRIVRWDHFLFSNPMLMLSWFQATSRFWNKKRPNQTVIIIICVDSIDCLFQNTRSCIQSFIRFVSLILSNWRVSSVFWKISLHSDAVYLLVSFWMALANVPLYQCACYCCYRCSYIQREDRRKKKHSAHMQHLLRQFARKFAAIFFAKVIRAIPYHFRLINERFETPRVIVFNFRLHLKLAICVYGQFEMF